jgi:hypothetical protein
MKIRIEIDCGNAALQDDDGVDEVELHRILCTVPPKVNKQLERDDECVCDAPEVADKLMDINGNTVGTLEVIDRDYGERCPHGNPLGDCTPCDVAGDLAFDAAREDRL